METSAAAACLKKLPRHFLCFFLWCLSSISWSWPFSAGSLRWCFRGSSSRATQILPLSLFWLWWPGSIPDSGAVCESVDPTTVLPLQHQMTGWPFSSQDLSDGLFLLKKLLNHLLPGSLSCRIVGCRDSVTSLCWESPSSSCAVLRARCLFQVLEPFLGFICVFSV